MAAFGGANLLVTRRLEVVYASEQVRRWPSAGLDALADPQLRQVVEQAWSTKERVALAVQVDTGSGLADMIVTAKTLKRRWVLLSLIDRSEEVQSARVRRDFMANIGHELRTPVTSVGLLATALKASADDTGAVEHFASRLERVAAQLEAMTESMTSLAQAEVAGGAQRRDPVAVAEIIESAVRLAHETALSRSVKVKVRHRGSAMVLGDQSRLITAVENLILNAIQYSSPGSAVQVSARVDHTEGIVSIHVIDSGIGIAASDQDRVFERFYRTDEARSQRTGGTGLGLAIVKHIALAHGGSVHVDSRVRSGSTFTLNLPLLESVGPESGESVARELDADHPQEDH
jgi:two-component system sensor histidine kinase SenX3